MRQDIRNAAMGVVALNSQETGNNGTATDVVLSVYEEDYFRVVFFFIGAHISNLLKSTIDGGRRQRRITCWEEDGKAWLIFSWGLGPKHFLLRS